MASIPQLINPIPLWLDCDPGHDDAFAILLAAYHHSIMLLGISSCYGNSSLIKTTNNALSILEAIGKPTISVFPGASKPFCRTTETATDIHGESGLDGTDLLPRPIRKPLEHCNAIKEMRDALMSCPAQTAWLVATGSMTNTGLLFATFPEVASHIRGLSIMGGAVGDDFIPNIYLGPEFTDSATGKVRSRIGNWTPWAEFNIWCDPEASQSIFRNPDLNSKIILIPLDITHTACATEQVRSVLLHGKAQKANEAPTRLRLMFNELLLFFASTYSQMWGMTEGPPLHDPLAVAAVLHSTLGQKGGIHFEDNGGERWDVDIVLDGEQIGRTLVKPSSSNKGVMIPRSMDLDAFWATLEDCMAKADQATGYKR